MDGLKFFSASPPILQIACDNCSQKSSDLEFFAIPPLKLQIIRLRYQRSGKTFEPRDVDVDYTVSFLKRTYPSGIINLRTRVVDWSPQPTFDGASPTFNCTIANSVLSQIRELDVNNGGDPLDHYYAMVFDGFDGMSEPDQFMRGCASVIAGKPDPSAVASRPTGTHQPQGWSRKPTYGDWYAAHELGHTFGRSHVGTTCGDQPSDPDYPFKGTLWVFSAIRRIRSSTQFRGPGFKHSYGDPSAKHFDSMTYCAGEWLSHYTYLGICSASQARTVSLCALR